MYTMLTQLTENNLAELTKDKVVLLDFSATWCAPCHMLGQELEELDNEKFDIIKIDIDDYEKLAQQYGIMVVPTMIVMVNGKEVKKVTGYHTKNQILEFMNEYTK